MILHIPSFAALDGGRLMEIYREGNEENARELWPELAPAEGVARAETDFLDYLQSSFFIRSGNEYRVLEEDGCWKSALRLYPVGEGLYYLEALETRPECRRQGCAARLLRGVLRELEESGPFVLRDCVGKANLPSLRTHESCGFHIAEQNGVSLLTGETNEYTYGMEYKTEKTSGR